MFIFATILGESFSCLSHTNHYMLDIKTQSISISRTMKRTRVRVASFLAFAAAFAAMTMTACQEGFDDNETFQSRVTGQQLESPTLTAENFKFVPVTDETSRITINWPLIEGAGGYHLIVSNMDDPQNPIVLVDEVIDGTTFQMIGDEDTNYKFSLQTEGNAQWNNTAAPSASEFLWGTLPQATLVPAGADLVAWMKENLADTDQEQRFELAPGTYNLNEVLDFGTRKVTLRGNKSQRTQLVLGQKGAITTSAGLKLKFLNVDASASESYGVIECSDQVDASVDNLRGRAYYLNDSIVVKHCWFKDVKSSLFHIGNNSWGVTQLMVRDCIVQLDNDGTVYNNGAVISTFSPKNLYNGKSSTYAGIRYIDIERSTFYNIKENNKNMFIKLRTNNFANLFDTNEGNCIMKQNTFSKTMTAGSGTVYFARFTPNNALYELDIENNVFYDCYRVSSLIQSQNTKKVEENSVFAVNGVHSNDSTMFAIQDPGFGDVLQSLDFSKENGGVNFKSNNGNGDPRWK